MVLHEEVVLCERIGRNLRVRRMMLGLTVEIAAQRAALPPRKWRLIEAGKLNPFLFTVARMARVVKMKIEDVLQEPSLRSA